MLLSTTSSIWACCCSVEPRRRRRRSRTTLRRRTTGSREGREEEDGSLLGFVEPSRRGGALPPREGRRDSQQLTSMDGRTECLVWCASLGARIKEIWESECVEEGLNLLSYAPSSDFSIDAALLPSLSLTPPTNIHGWMDVILRPVLIFFSLFKTNPRAYKFQRIFFFFW